MIQDTAYTSRVVIDGRRRRGREKASAAERSYRMDLAAQATSILHFTLVPGLTLSIKHPCHEQAAESPPDLT